MTVQEDFDLGAVLEGESDLETAAQEEFDGDQTIQEVAIWIRIERGKQ
mgnify:CR=1 FL=1